MNYLKELKFAHKKNKCEIKHYSASFNSLNEKATAFFIPNKKDGKLYHKSYSRCGLIYKDYVYELIQYRGRRMSPLSERKDELDKLNARYVEINIDPNSINEYFVSENSDSEFLLKITGHPKKIITESVDAFYLLQ